MTKKKAGGLLLAGLLVVGILAAGHLVFWDRYYLEKDFNQVEVMMEYQDILNISALSAKSEPEILKYLKAQGLTTVLFKEMTVVDIDNYQPVAVFTAGQLQGWASLAAETPGWWQQLTKANKGLVPPGTTYLLFQDRQSFDRVIGQLAAKTNRWQAHVYEGTPASSALYIIETALPTAALKKMGLGFPEQKLQLVEQAGLNTMVQIRSWPLVTAPGLQAALAPLADINNLSGILFNDQKIPGVDEKLLPELAANIREITNPAVVTIEFFPQQGLTNLALLLDKNVIRLHTIAPDEMQHYDNLARALDRYVLAAAERNHRVLLVRPFGATAGQDVFTVNAAFLSQLQTELQQAGLQLGTASKLPTFPVSRVLMFLIGLAVISGGLMLLSKLGGKSAVLPAGGAALLLWAALLLVVPDLARKLMALAAVLVFPTLAVLIFVNRQKRVLHKAVARLLAMSACSLIGALLMAGLLADAGFMLKLDQFAGIKLAHFLPLVLVVAYFAYQGTVGQGWRKKMISLWQKPLTLGYAAVIGALLMVVAVYLMRTGNEAMLVSQWELQFRSLLDNWLGVRPRTKEFLLGYPAMLALLYFGYRHNWFLPLVVLGTIGQISMVNTFAHLHTPLLISLERTFNGLVLGIIIGVLVILTYKVVRKILIGFWQNKGEY